MSGLELLLDAVFSLTLHLCRKLFFVGFIFFLCFSVFLFFSIHKMFAFKQSQITLIWSLVIFTQCCEIPTFVRMLKKLLRRVLDTAEWGIMFNVLTLSRVYVNWCACVLSSNDRINRTPFVAGVFILFGCPTSAEAACFVWRRTHWTNAECNETLVCRDKSFCVQQVHQPVECSILEKCGLLQ